MIIDNHVTEDRPGLISVNSTKLFEKLKAKIADDPALILELTVYLQLVNELAGECLLVGDAPVNSILLKLGMLAESNPDCAEYDPEYSKNYIARHYYGH